MIAFSQSDISPKGMAQNKLPTRVFKVGERPMSRSSSAMSNARQRSNIVVLSVLILCSANSPTTKAWTRLAGVKRKRNAANQRQFKI